MIFVSKVQVHPDGNSGFQPYFGEKINEFYQATPGEERNLKLGHCYILGKKGREKLKNDRNGKEQYRVFVEVLDEYLKF